MKNLKKGFNDEEILEFHWKSNTKEMKQINKSHHRRKYLYNNITFCALFRAFFVHSLSEKKFPVEIKCLRYMSTLSRKQFQLGNLSIEKVNAFC